MNSPLALNLPLLKFQGDLIIKQNNGNKVIWDPVRKKFVRLTPEEMVRQLFIQYLVREKSYSLPLISVEKSLSLDYKTKRFDLLVYNRFTKPYLLVECKAPNLQLTQEAMDQVAIYNQKFNVPYLIITNGKETIIAKIDYRIQGFNYLDNIPSSPSPEEE